MIQEQFFFKADFWTYGLWFNLLIVLIQFSQAIRNSQEVLLDEDSIEKQTGSLKAKVMGKAVMEILDLFTDVWYLLFYPHLSIVYSCVLLLSIIIPIVY